MKSRDDEAFLAVEADNQVVAAVGQTTGRVYLGGELLSKHSVAMLAAIAKHAGVTVLGRSDGQYFFPLDWLEKEKYVAADMAAMVREKVKEADHVDE